LCAFLRKRREVYKNFINNIIIETQAQSVEKYGIAGNFGNAFSYNYKKCVRSGSVVA